MARLHLRKHAQVVARSHRDARKRVLRLVALGVGIVPHLVALSVIYYMVQKQPVELFVWVHQSFWTSWADSHGCSLLGAQ